MKLSTIAAAWVVTGLVLPTVNAQTQAPPWSAAVDAALGRHGTMQPGRVYKFSFPRSDLRVTVGSVQVKPALALGSWLAFLPVGRGDAVVIGDLVLTESEIAPVMQALQAGEIRETALHNHLRDEMPHMMYMHVMGRGNPDALARTIRRALEASATPMTPTGPPAVSASFDLDTLAISRALGHAGKINGGVYQVSVQRAEVVRADGNVIPPAMGVATAINLQPTTRGRAAVTGDFVLLGREVDPVMRYLRAHGIAVTALHSHMLDEMPRLYFMHFWAEDDAQELAAILHSALDLTNSLR